ncbi:uncharacterized protein LOC6532988 [Drosophila yakuba]|uniref:DUF4781 domain-containing protein n=1 Tax=Drosophila yakuba TaxID=7245 RepID=B4PI93_DROYA|nr:uncharacterized protein LOC6532988 [Drosophila yakuba]EDW93435.2 uncharacterized protein Dyak_GE20602 [Drosophila yakuba]
MGKNISLQKMSAAKEKDESLVPTVREVQQKFADLLGHNNEVTWDLLSASQQHVLEAKLSQLHCHPRMLHWIWSNRMYSNGQCLSSLFFVMLVDNVYDLKMAEQSRSWRLYPVFRCRRCVDETGKASNINCCMSYVTQYTTSNSWKVLLAHNGFGSGLLVTPDLGVYKQVDGQVELKSYSNTEILFPEKVDLPITPESLKKASNMTIKHIKHQIQSENPFFAIPIPVYEFCDCEKMLNVILMPGSTQKSCDVADLSDSLVIFTNNINNSRLGALMKSNNNDPSILVNQQRAMWDKIAGESIRIEDNVHLIRSGNGVPTKAKLDKILQHVDSKRKQRKKRMEPKNRENTPIALPEMLSIRVKGEDINLREFGTVLKEHIASLESFDILISSMSEHLEVDTFKLIMQLTQTFVENVREEMCQILKYYFSTESILYQIILCISKHHPNWNFNEIEEQSSNILRRVRMFFASTAPNSRTEFLKKCEYCVGYYDKCRLT